MSLPHVPMMATVGKGPQHLHLLCCPRLPSCPLAIPSCSCLALDLTIHLSACHVKGAANLQFPWDSRSQSPSSHISVLPHIGHPAGDVQVIPVSSGLSNLSRCLFPGKWAHPSP